MLAHDKEKVDPEFSSYSVSRDLAILAKMISGLTTLGKIYTKGNLETLAKETINPGYPSPDTIKSGIIIGAKVASVLDQLPVLGVGAWLVALCRQ